MKEVASKAGTAAAHARMGRLPAGCLVLFSVALLVLGAVLFHLHAPRVALVSLQWAGSDVKANMIVHRGAYGRYREALSWDVVALIPGYGLGLFAACLLGWRVFWTPQMQRIAVVGACSAVAAALCNLAQDGLLWITLRHRPMQGVWLFRAVAALSFVKFSVLLVAAVIGLIALSVTTGRLVLHRHTKDHWRNSAEEYGGEEKYGGESAKPEKFAFAPVISKLHHQAKRELSPEALWAKAGGSAVPDSHWIQGSTFPAGPDKNQVGICLSGGGIRSATVALGALQVLGEETPSANGKGASELERARYLVSVSGGGYTAAAYQLALHAGNGAGPGTGPAEVFAPGSPEEDHLRRHSSYISDTPGQWATALGILFRCVATAIVLIGLTVTALGLAIGRFYRDIPIVTEGLAGLRPLFLRHTRIVKGKPRLPAPHWPVIPWGVTLAVLAVLVLAVVAYVIHLSLSSLYGRSAKRTAAAGNYLIGLTGLLVALGIVIPALVWLSGWLTWQVHFSGGPAITTGTIAGITTYFGALAATLWRKKTTLTTPAGTGGVRSLFAKSPGGQVLPNSMVQMLLLWLCLLVLVLAAILTSGWVAASGLDSSWWALLPVGVLLFAAIFIDETWLSLQNFYRRRLTSAFAIDLAADSEAAGPGDVPGPGHAPGKQQRTEETPLSTYGARPENNRFPEVQFAATANITGQDRTPPGRRAVPFMLGSKYIGGPQAGWVATGYLEKLVGKTSLRRDLDVTAARAISGAAFAAAMGSQTRFYELFLALANVRLGTWLPNPWFVALKSQHLDDWTVPGLPSRRRLSYLAREIFGIHPSWARMLLCTDGGHYDNLGLIELLRLRCGLIYCFDASGGGAPLADTLAGTLALAREELGVYITLTNQFSLVPGGMNPPPFSASSPLASLNIRVSNSAVIVGDIKYPEEDAPTGKLIFAQAALTTSLPYQVLEYSQNDPGFPRDSTADQWFNSQQFDAYQQLGRYLGQQAVQAAAATHPRWWGGPQAADRRMDASQSSR